MWFRVVRISVLFSIRKWILLLSKPMDTLVGNSRHQSCLPVWINTSLRIAGHSKGVSRQCSCRRTSHNKGVPYYRIYRMLSFPVQWTCFCSNRKACFSASFTLKGWMSGWKFWTSPNEHPHARCYSQWLQGLILDIHLEVKGQDFFTSPQRNMCVCVVTGTFGLDRMNNLYGIFSFNQTQILWIVFPDLFLHYCVNCNGAKMVWLIGSLKLL